MVNIAEMNVLAVGMEDRAELFRDLPVHVLTQTLGIEAIRSFKTDQIDSVICHWHLSDMPDGLFLRRLKSAMPQVPVVAIVEPGNLQQEIEARQWGAAAVIPEDCGGDYFQQVIMSVLGLPKIQEQRLPA
jgi:DNA-binding NarL/FixJ family response regulator